MKRKRQTFLPWLLGGPSIMVTPLPRASPPCTSSTDSRPGAPSQHSFSCRSDGWSSHRMDACRGEQGGRGTHHQGHQPGDGWTPPATQAPSRWQYLHKSLLVDLQLRLRRLKGGSGEEAQEELPWDLALESHLQVGMVLMSPPPPQHPADNGTSTLLPQSHSPPRSRWETRLLPARSGVLHPWPG